MTFVCQCCGDCCSTMGEIITVQEQISPYEFRIAFTDGEERVVSVDRDKRELFHASVQEKEKSLACPFLRRLASCERICTIYTSRPDLCRSYLCSLSSFSIGTGKKPGWCLTGPNPSE